MFPGGYSWSYNTQLFFEEYYPDVNPGLWLALCSIIGGSFGVFVGGMLSDFAVKRLGLHSRLWILSICTVWNPIIYFLLSLSRE